MTSPGDQFDARPFLPLERDLPALAAAAAGCRGCPLWEDATQTVFGAGSPSARIVLVGEQPGDVEDRSGLPFVGPAGKLLDRCLEEAGIARGETYVTNAVKHFKWEPRGKRRIHSKPSAREVRACRPWLEAEIAALRPGAIVCLGATAAQALLGPSFRLTQHRGELLPSPFAPVVLATLHPAALLRERDPEIRDLETQRLAADLAAVREALLARAHGPA